MTQRLLHLVIFGAQGSGKGTQAQRLSDEFGLINLGAGEILRQIAQEATELGRQVHEIINVRGALVPDQIINEIFAQKIASLPPTVGFILDGYPRRVAQAEALHHTLQGLGREIPREVYVNLNAPRDVLLKRIAKRREIEGREDDTGPALERRLQWYGEETAPILEAVTDWAEVVHINGDQPIADVTAEIISKLADVE